MERKDTCTSAAAYLAGDHADSRGSNAVLNQILFQQKLDDLQAHHGPPVSRGTSTWVEAWTLFAPDVNQALGTNYQLGDALTGMQQVSTSIMIPH